MRARTAVPCLSREPDVLACIFDGASVGGMRCHPRLPARDPPRILTGRKKRIDHSIFGDFDLKFKTERIPLNEGNYRLRAQPRRSAHRLTLDRKYDQAAIDRPTNRERAQNPQEFRARLSSISRMGIRHARIIGHLSVSMRAARRQGSLLLLLLRVVSRRALCTAIE